MADTLPVEDFTMNYEEIKINYSKSDGGEDSFDFTATPVVQKVGLLLPAVQQVREPSSLPPDEVDPKDSFDFTAAPEDGASALLLPAVQSVREAARRSDADDELPIATKDDGGTAYEYKLDGVMISSYDVNGAADSDHDKWIDVLSTDWGTSTPGKVVEAGLRRDGELVQAVSEADMGGDFIL